MKMLKARRLPAQLEAPAHATERPRDRGRVGCGSRIGGLAGSKRDRPGRE